MSQSKLGLNHPVRVDKIIAHRTKRKECMATTLPTPKVDLAPGSPFQLNQIPYCNRFLMAASSCAGGEVLWIIKGLKHLRAVKKERKLKVNANDGVPEMIFVLTIIDEPYIESELSIGDFTAPKNFLVETPNKEVCTFRMSGLPDDAAAMEMFAVGTKIHKFEYTDGYISFGEKDDSYFCFFADARNNAVYPLGMVNNACRYCLKENARKKCSACGVPYCSRECQNADWKIMKHELVCKNNDSLSGPSVTSSGKENHKKSEFASFKTSNPKMAQPKLPGLGDPERVSRIQRFRKTYAFSLKRVGACDFARLHPTAVRVPEMEIPRNPTLIVLKDMKCDSFYWEKAIELTIIDELLLGLFCDYVCFLVEDNNRDVTCLAVKGLFRPEVQNYFRQFQVGTRVRVVHPFFKLGTADGLPFIRVENLATVKIMGMKRDMCRFCGKENAKRQCSRMCRRLYCGEPCEAMDRQILNHACICETGPFPLSEVCLYAHREQPHLAKMLDAQK